MMVAVVVAVVVGEGEGEGEEGEEEGAVVIGGRWAGGRICVRWAV